MDSHCPKKRENQKMKTRENQKMVRSVVDVKNKPREIFVGVYRLKVGPSSGWKYIKTTTDAV